MAHGPAPPAPAPIGGAAVETFALTRRFGAVVAVDAVSLSIAAGEIFGLIGSNGAGKTTLIKMLTTMLRPTSGRAIVAGFDIATQPGEVRKRIGYVPQLLSADRELTGEENLMLSARLYLIPRAERGRRVEEALAMMGLTEARHRLARDYSGGMLRRLEIAQSMLHRPIVFFMDEPTVGLDPAGRQTVWELMRRLRHEANAAVVVTTHYMDEAEELCDRIAILHSGKLVAVGTAAELRARAGVGTLDEAFVALAGSESETSGGYRHAREARRSAAEHG